MSDSLITVHLPRAVVVGGNFECEPVPYFMVAVTDESPPNGGSIEHHRDWYATHAAKLLAALRQTTPQGFLAALLVALLDDQRDVLSIRAQDRARP